MANISLTHREVMTALFIGMFKAVPGTERLQSMVDEFQRTGGLKQVSQFLTNAEFRSVYPVYLTPTEFAERFTDYMLRDLVGSAEFQWSQNWVSKQLSEGMPAGEVVLQAVNLLLTTDNPAFAQATALLRNRMDMAHSHTVEYGKDAATIAELQAYLAGIDNTPQSLQTAKAGLLDGLIGNAVPEITAIVRDRPLVDEGAEVQFTVATAGFAAGTELSYVLEGVAASDLASPMSGTIVLDANGFGHVVVRINPDVETEGREMLRFRLVDHDASATVLIGDVQLTPVYTLALDKTQIAEGDTLTLTLDSDIAIYGAVPLSISGIDGNDVVGGLPASVTMTAGQGSLSLQLRSDYTTEGTETLQISAGQASVAASITDSSVAPALSISSNAASVNEGGDVVLTFTTAQSLSVDVPVSIGGISAADLQQPLPTAVTLVNGNGTLVLQLAADQNTEGTETLALSVGAASITVTINDTSITPQPFNDTVIFASGLNGSAVDISVAQLLANDRDASGQPYPDGTAITLASIDPAAGFSILLQDGSLQFQGSGQARSYQFGYSIPGVDGSAQVSVIFNTAPVLTSIGSLSVAEDGTVSGALTASDADGDTLSYSTSASHGSVSYDGTTLSYTPTANYNGTDTIQITVNDGRESISTTVAVQVTAVDDAPVAVSPAPATVQAVAGKQVSIDLRNYVTDVDTAAAQLVFTLASSTTSRGGSVTVNGSTATVSYPANGGSAQLGTDSFSFSVGDGTTTLGSLSVGLQVTNTAPQASAITATTQLGTTLAIDLTGKISDADGHSLHVDTESSSFSNGGSASYTNYAISYAPASGFMGTDTFTYKVFDGYGSSSPATVTVTVTAQFEGSSGADTLTGTAADESFNGLGGGDTINAGNGNNTIAGGDGNDTITGGSGNDSIEGGTGTDSITAGSGRDTIKGGDGNDTINGGQGADSMTGGSGADVFVMASGDSLSRTAENVTVSTLANTETFTFGNGVDVITDFVSGTDKLDVATANNYTAIGNGGNASNLTGNNNYSVRGTFNSGTGVFTLDFAGGTDLLVVTNAANADLDAAGQTSIVILTGITSLAGADFI